VIISYVRHYANINVACMVMAFNGERWSDGTLSALYLLFLCFANMLHFVNYVYI